MKRITFVLQSVTPMFMAGADGKTFELRPPAIKGLLRFWWRAYYWGQHIDRIDIKDELSEIEGQIFGTSSNNGRKSRFSIQIAQQNYKLSKKRFPSKPNFLIPVISNGKSRKMNIFDYLTYGMYDFKNKHFFEREYLEVGQSFEISFSFPQDMITVGKKTIHIQDEIVKSFYLTSFFGGLGAKSHNGFGSFMICKTEPHDILPQYTLQAPLPEPNWLTEFTNNSTIPPFTAFSKEMEIFKLKPEQPYPKWDDCLAELGKVYRAARESLGEKHACHKRQYIGAPMNVDGKESFLKRRAKPYFLRVIETDDGFDGYIMYLPSEYCTGMDEYEDKYKQKHVINHTNVNKEFQATCDQVNQFFKHEMEVIL